MLLEQPVERAAAGSAIQPDGDFVRCRWVCRREEPEPELIDVRAILVNRQGPGIRLADVKVHKGNAGAVHRKFWLCQSYQRLIYNSRAYSRSVESSSSIVGASREVGDFARR